MLKEMEILKLYFDAIDNYNAAHHRYHEVARQMRIGEREMDEHVLDNYIHMFNLCLRTAEAYKTVLNKQEETFQRDIDQRASKFSVKKQGVSDGRAYPKSAI